MSDKHSAFCAQAVREYGLDTVERYYDYMAQGNTFAPKFDQLRPEVQAKWQQEYDAAALLPAPQGAE
jgi:hypothetical protein